MSTLWSCNRCSRHIEEPYLLRAPSPFDKSETLTACPYCKQCDEGFTNLCDEPGCGRPAGCGWPTGDANDQWKGYRRTCGKHMVKKEASKA